MTWYSSILSYDIYRKIIQYFSDMSTVSSGPLPKLQHAQFEKVETDEINVKYKSGAVFKGKVCDHRRIGSGKFTWPNGAQYEGEYQDNLRNGKG
jgi:hypothetical protein